MSSQGIHAFYISLDDPVLLALPKRINWNWLGFTLCGVESIARAAAQLSATAPDIVVVCLDDAGRAQLALLTERACPSAKIVRVDPAAYRADPDACVGRLIETLTGVSRQLSEERDLLMSSAFITRRAEELSERIVRQIDAGDYDGLKQALSAYVETVISRSKGSNQFIYVKIMELLLLAGYKPMQLRTCFDRLLEGDFCKKLQQIIAHNGMYGIDRYLYDSILQSVSQSAAVPPEQGGAAIFERAIRYIGDNYRKKLSLEEVSHQAYMSSSYFSNTFHQRMGITFSEYLSILRMNCAKELLTTTSLRVYEVAERSGYEDFRHFSKMFKKHTGFSPAEYRKHHE